MKIAVLYIALGKYDVFFEEFYESAKQFFLTKYEKHFFVFTDSLREIFNQKDVTIIHQNDMGWPDNTLMRFHMFESISQQLMDFSYIFFFNANVEFVKMIGEEILPDRGLVCVQHPGFWDKDRREFTYERNSLSEAYISEEKGVVYVCGGVNGGKAEDYLAMVHELKNRIERDRRRGIVALYHDESHLNKYIIDRNDVRILDPGYCYPDMWECKKFERKIRIRWKQLYIDVSKLRGEKMSLRKKIRYSKYRRRILKEEKKREL